MIGAVIDVETTGFDFKGDRIIEAGIAVVDLKKKKPIEMIDLLVLPFDATNFFVPPKITEITGITTDELLSYGISSIKVFQELGEYFKKADYIIAHNGTRFDKIMLDAELQRHKNYLNLENFQKPWLDTTIDVPYPKSIETRKLKYLAAEHNISTPFSHRALFDVITTMEILFKYDIEEVIRRSKSPSLYVIAEIDYNTRQKAKDRGFRWNGDKKHWFRIVKEDDLEREPPLDFEFRLDPLNNCLT